MDEHDDEHNVTSFIVIVEVFLKRVEREGICGEKNGTDN